MGESSVVGLSSEAGEADSNDNLHTTSLGSQDILSSEEATLDNDNAANTPSNNALSPSMKRRTRECNVWFLALRDDEPFKKLLGQWGDASSFHFPRSYLVSSNSEQNKIISNGEATPEMISFRAQVSRLPFAIRFQLERILLDNSIIPIQHEEQPEEARDELRQEIAINARRLVFNFVEHVLPPLLEMEWEVDVDNFTLSELFALAIEADLRAAKEAVKEGKSITFGDNAIIRAMEQANDWLVKAERVCRSNEPQLAVDYGSFDINILKRRAMWPIADYKCKFTINGDLIPADYIIPALMAQTYTTESRRGQREGGWLVRDRFCCISKIETGEPFRSEMVGWLRNEPMMCNRKYEFLFDKGVAGKTSIWLYSSHNSRTSRRRPSLEVTRNVFLSSIGSFENTNASKIGDRISLAFTQTRPIIYLSEEQIEVIPDIIRNGYSFSDGCGVMGIGIAQKIQESLNLRSIPGAVQVRVGGVKGMLSLKVDFKANSIGVRPSMIKFVSNHRVLEVKREAKAIAANTKLFKEALLVLDHLGVPAKVFYDLQEKACAEFASEHDDPDALEIMQEQSHRSKESQYLRNALKRGLKGSGDAFTGSELESIRTSLSAAKEKVNLRCSVTLMQGVVDEYNVLQEGQVLVGNGRVTGKVLICRSPCVFPGDIQKFTAVAGLFDEAFNSLDQTLVFSAKGRKGRPLPDMLAGGDLDGDEYYIIDEAQLVDTASCVEPHDFGTQNSCTKIHPGRVYKADYDPVAPIIHCQLDALQQLLNLGNLVPDAAMAWLRIADKVGVSHPQAQRLANLYQQALDARKTALTIDTRELDNMESALEMSAPHYMRKHEGKMSRSLLGVLFENWRYWIKVVDINAQKLINPSQESSLAIESKENEKRKDDVNSILLHLDENRKNRLHGLNVGNFHRYCVACGGRGNMRCNQCETAWICSRNECSRRHFRLCFYSHWTSVGETRTEITGETIVFNSSESAPIIYDDNDTDTASIVSTNTDISLLADGLLESLINIVFQRTAISCDDIEPVDWRFLEKKDLVSLGKLVKLEFKEDIHRGMKHRRHLSDATRDFPHIHDIFTMEPLLQRQNIQLAVCVQYNKGAGGHFMWRDKNQTFYPMDPPFHLFRIGSLSATHRILESLNTNPLPGSLMDCAMRRDPGLLMEAVDHADQSILLLEPKISNTLNTSQKRACATILSPHFREGFFLIQGPPGTGKTWVLCSMVDSLRGGLVVAPSNAAVANAALKLLSLGRFDARSVVIYGENCDDAVHFLSPGHRYKRFLSFKKEYESLQGKTEKQVDMFSAFVQWLRLDQEVTFPDLESICKRVDDTPKGQQALVDFIDKAKVVLCTMNTAGSHFIRQAVRGKFDTLFIDEAAQIPETEFYIATSFPGVKRIVLVGDPMQLGATVINIDCESAGYGESWFSHVMDVHPHKVHLLNVQYRCDQRIMQFSNINFYESAVRTSRSVIDRQPVFQHAIGWINTFPNGEEESVGTSYRNNFEAESVRRLLCSDDDIKLLIAQCKHPAIIVITPYRAQVDLLKKELSKVKSLEYVRVATVDSFQGQEGDIVIVSTVRSNSIGFTDHSQRINVAMTRAKRILRIVGDSNLFLQGSQDSILRKLIIYCNEHGLVQDDPRIGKHKKDAWRKPDWALTAKCLWKPTMTAKFHHSLKNLRNIMDRNVAFNTLLAVAMPNERALYALPISDRGIPVWQTSALKNHEEHLQIVWVAKEGNPDNVLDDERRPVIEAHYAGSKHKCLHFVQTHPLVPQGAVCIKRDLSGVDVKDNGNNVGHSQNIELSWTLTGDIGDAVLDGSISELPEGCFDLDPMQTKVLETKPPLLLESRSGTGKTNVLFQHALAHARSPSVDQGIRPICFVTVSPRLRKELARRYNEIEALEKISLPPVKFFSLRELLDGLLQTSNADIKMSDACNFLEYVHSRKSYVDLVVESSEVENEIGGVIMGSLEAALKKSPLTRDEYISNKRSNVSGDSEEGRAKRHAIYDEYEQYRKWKLNTEKFDMNDVVLKLITSRTCRRQWFDSAYLDEIQDFSSASIYLIANIAGKDHIHWVCAGDTAQMISPGCSFTFDGLKQVLLAVKPGIEQYLKGKNIVSLETNYRVTKDVLLMSNSILNTAKKYFSDKIELATPEIAVKDLGTKVLLCDWNEALREKVVFGTNQALIFCSTNDEKNIHGVFSEWLNDHPFILTPLDSKGLEFDDVVVGFDVERKAWNINSDRISSLRLLRELYVAITRAKRRVVILVKKEVSAMRVFFETLQKCDIVPSDAKVALLEFDAGTTVDDWLVRGKELLEEEQFKMSASCFKAAGNFAYFNFAQGQYLVSIGRNVGGKDSFCTSAKYFFGEANYKMTLDLLALIMEHPPWRPELDYMYDVCTSKLPSYFPREKAIRFALSRQKWNEITIADLTTLSTASLILPFREQNELKTMIASCTNSERTQIEHSLPTVVGDYYLERKDYTYAVDLYLEGSDVTMAMGATDSLLDLPQSKTRTSKLVQIVALWNKPNNKRAHKNVSRDSHVFLLLQLFENPIRIDKSQRIESYQKFGKDIVKIAFEHSNAPAEELHSFNREEFETEVGKALLSKYRNNRIEAVLWYINHDSKSSAEKLVERYISDWSKGDLIVIVRHKLHTKGLLEEADRQHVLLDLVEEFLSKQSYNLDHAVEASDIALSSLNKSEENAAKLLKIWENRIDRRIVSLFSQKQAKPPGPKIILLLNLFSDPRSTSKQPAVSKYCMRFFGRNIVEAAVSRSVPKASERFSVLCKFDANAFQHLRPSQGKTSPKEERDEFFIGDNVTIYGLQKKPELNGKRGKIATKFDAKKGSFGVKLDGFKNMLGVKPANLKIFRSGSQSSSDDNDDGNNSPLGPKGVENSRRKQDKKGSSNNVTSKQYKSKPPAAESDSDSSNDSIPPLASRAHSSSDDDSSDDDTSSGDGSIPGLIPRGVQSESSSNSNDDNNDIALTQKGAARSRRNKNNTNTMVSSKATSITNNRDKGMSIESDESDSDSSASSPPPLMSKDISSSDDDSIPQLLDRANENSSSSSSDESEPNQSQRATRDRRMQQRNSKQGGKGKKGKR